MSQNASLIARWYQFALQQVAAESYLAGVNFRDRDIAANALRSGNNDASNPYIASLPDDKYPGKTRLAAIQANQFTSRYQIVSQVPNDASGFSATLLLDTQTNEYTLSFRSLEYRYQSQGGDFERDAQGASLEIHRYGFALEVSCMGSSLEISVII